MDNIIIEIQSPEFNKDAINMATFYNDRLRPKIECLYNSYDNLNFKDENQLITKKKEYERAIKATYLFNHVCLIELHNNGFNETKHNLFLFTNAHINRLQNNLFSITYHIQQKNSETAFCFAKLIAFISLLFAIASIILTCCYGENSTSCSCYYVELPKTEKQQIISEKDSSSVENSVVPLKLDKTTKIKSK
ncbi:MAG: hypothetical protein LBQ13_00685 [Endomicrobium sp.]|jgi:hypothetical protein|nr:hypothetical protein [Endomicrobium sp.]